MRCASCGGTFEGRFCPWCGTAAPRPAPPMVGPPPPPAYAPVVWATYCLYCGLRYAGTACPNCGTLAGRAGPGVFPRSLGSLTWAISVALVLSMLVANLVALGYAVLLVVEGAGVSGGPLEFILLVPYPVGIVVDASAEAFLGYFGLLVVTILGAYGFYAWKDGRSLVRTFRRPLAQFGWRLEARNAWVATAQVFLAAMSFQILFILALTLAGFDPQAPTGPGISEWYTYYLLANASVYEEVIARVLLLGVPLFLAGIAYNARVGPTEHGTPSWKHLIGGTLHRDSPFPLLAVGGAFAVLSAVVFALGHVPAWGWWKFTPTLVMGLGLAYLFLRHGFLAGVLAHFAVDYFGAIGLMASNNLGALIILGLFVLVIVALGVPFFLWYCLYGAKIISHVRSRMSGSPGPPSRGGPALPAPFPPTAFGPPPPPSPP